WAGVRRIVREVLRPRAIQSPFRKEQRGPLATCQRGAALSPNSKDTTRVYAKRTIYLCTPLPRQVPTAGTWSEVYPRAHRQKNSQWRDVHWRTRLLREVLYRTIQFILCDQYSSGNMRIVAERSASVKIHIVCRLLLETTKFAAYRAPGLFY